MLSRGLKRTVVGLKSLPVSSNRVLLNNLPAVALQTRMKRTWASDDPAKLQKMTEQALIHDISLHQMETGQSDFYPPLIFSCSEGSCAMVFELHA